VGRGGGGQPALRLPGFRERALQRVREVDVARLVIGRVRVCDVRGEQFLALRAQAQRGFVKTQVIVEFADHAASGR
jgi:hypothetical protein